MNADKRRFLVSAFISVHPWLNEDMYHYDPQTALEELQEDALLPNPVHIRDMIVRAKLAPDQALELNRKFQTYLGAYGDTQQLAKSILEQLGARP